MSGKPSKRPSMRRARRMPEPRSGADRENPYMTWRTRSEVLGGKLLLAGRGVGHVFRERGGRRGFEPRNSLRKDFIDVLKRGQQARLVVGREKWVAHRTFGIEHTAERPGAQSETSAAATADAVRTRCLTERAAVRSAALRLGRRFFGCDGCRGSFAPREDKTVGDAQIGHHGGRRICRGERNPAGGRSLGSPRPFRKRAPCRAAPDLSGTRWI